MIKPKKFELGDKIAIVSLSRGLLGEPFVRHELDLAVKRLKEFGLEPVIMPNALKGMNFLDEHPEARAKDLKDAFLDDSIKGIMTAIGGIDTYRLYPYLFEDEEFINAVRNHPKIFTGFSDTTMNHLMFYRLGLQTFYGPCLLVDIAELDNEMLPYTKKYFEKYFQEEEEYEIESSNVWYSDRENYSTSQLGKSRIIHKEEHGYELLNGGGVVTGYLYGGCIESIYDAMTGATFAEEKDIVQKYNVLLTLDEYKDKILFLETSERSSSPEELEKMLYEFKNRGIFSSIKGLIVGKPIDEKYYEEYKVVYKKVFENLDTPILYNINFGHSVPRCILPYGAQAVIDYDNKKIKITEPIFNKSNT